MKRLSVIVLLLCTCLWIIACGESPEILTVEMYDNYMTQEPILLTVVMPASNDVSELIFQINGTIYHAQNLPTEENPMFSLIAEDGVREAYLTVRGFWDEAAMISFDIVELSEEDLSYWECHWDAQTVKFAPLQAWLENAETET